MSKNSNNSYDKFTKKEILDMGTEQLADILWDQCLYNNKKRNNKNNKAKKNKTLGSKGINENRGIEHGSRNSHHNNA
ncbi:MAG: hypothetical protein ABIE68_05035 [bacterium]